MEIKDLLLFLDQDHAASRALDLAEQIARDQGAFVTGVCLHRSPEPAIADCYAIGEAAAADVIDRERRSLAQALAPVETAFRRAMARAGAGAQWLWAASGETPEASALRARLSDLVILRRPADRDDLGRGLAAALLLAEGAPCLLAPDEAAARPFERVLLAWNGSRQAKRAMDAAMPFLKAARAVEVAVAGRAPSEQAAAGLAAVLQHLGRHGVPAAPHWALDEGSAEEALLGRCAAFAADLLVMGAWGQPRAAEFLLGGATRAVLSRSSWPVLMRH